MQGDKVLFEDREIAGYTVRPWTLGQLVKLAPVFERVAVNFAARGLSLSAIGTALETSPMNVLTPLLPEIATVLSITLGKPIEEMEGLRADTVISVILVIVKQNVEYLKNSLGPVSDLLRQVITQS
jgi:hypothetical protein